MRKSQLLQLPIPPMAHTISLPPAKTDDQANYFYTAQVDDSTGERVLIIDLYLTDGEHRWRYFLNESGQYFRLMADGKISNAGMDHIFDWNFNYRSTRFYEPETRTIIAEFLCKKDLEDPLKSIAEVNRQHKLVKHERELDKIRARLDDEMLEITPLPEGVEKWVDEVLLKRSRYMIYKYAAKKQVDARCTYCDGMTKISKPKHGEKGKCPHCKSAVEYLSLGRLSGYNFADDNERFAYLQPTSDGFFVREYVAKRRFNAPITDLKADKIKLTLSERSRIRYRYDAGEKQYLCEKAYVYQHFKSLYEKRFCEGWVNLRCAAIYPENLNSLLKRDGKYPHIDFDGIAKHCGEMRIDNLLAAVARNRSLENLYKSKLYKVVNAIIEGNLCKYNWLDKSQTSARKALSLGSDDIKVVSQLNLSLEEIDIYHFVKEREGKVDIDTFKKLRDMGVCGYGIKDILSICTLHGTTRYLSEQVAMAKDDSHNVKSLWKDYLEFANNLGAEFGYDLKLHNVRYPLKLKEAHDRASEDNRKHKEKILAKKLEKIAGLYPSYLKKYGFEHGGLIIRPPTDYAELRNEGAKLCHCVANYAQDVYEQRTVILFIRKKVEPDKPYFTLELNPDTHEIRQCRGLKNCNYGADIKKFIEKYSEKLENKTKKERRHTA